MKSPLGQYLQRLPARLVDVVVAGRNHKKTANFINGIAVVSGFEAGKSFSYIELSLEEKALKVIPEETVIHQPVMVCREFFKETNDCYTEDPSVNHRERIPAKFLGVLVERNEDIRTRLGKFFDEVSEGMLPATESLRKKLDADIVYRESEGASHLVMLELTGAELSRWLEESYNLEHVIAWRPSPFRLKGDELSLFLNGEELSHSRTYKILTDLESLQSRRSLQKFITSVQLRTFQEIGWNSDLPADEVTVSVAGPAR